MENNVDYRDMSDEALDNAVEEFRNADAEPVVVDDLSETEPELDTEVTEAVEAEVYDEIESTAFLQELQYEGSTGMELHLAVTSSDAIVDGQYSPEVVSLAKAHGLSDEDIQKHQDTLVHNVNTAIDDIYSEVGFSRAYGETVVQWARSNFSADELAIFEKETNENPVKSLKTLEIYYQHEMNGANK